MGEKSNTTDALKKQQPPESRNRAFFSVEIAAVKYREV